jgi:hypothetical protein
VGHLLLADSHTSFVRTWDEFAVRLVWAQDKGYRTAKARCAHRNVDRPLLPSEQERLVESATRLVLD